MTMNRCPSARQCWPLPRPCFSLSTCQSGAALAYTFPCAFLGNDLVQLTAPLANDRRQLWTVTITLATQSARHTVPTRGPGSSRCLSALAAVVFDGVAALYRGAFVSHVATAADVKMSVQWPSCDAVVLTAPGGQASVECSVVVSVR